MSQATTCLAQQRITKLIPLQDQIEMISLRIKELEQLHFTCTDTNSLLRYETKVNFWSNVLRQLETLKAQSK